MLEVIHPEWAKTLVAEQSALRRIEMFLENEARVGVRVLPERAAVMRAFRDAPSKTKVLIVGQDPYPTPGHAVGLSFSVAQNVRPLPKSLQNIFRELQTDLGLAPPLSGDLSPWARQGVMLLNRVLTVRAKEPASHRGIGWEEVTSAAIKALAAREKPLVAILWGNEARSLKPILKGVPVIESSHPSPLSAHRGFFGSKPFSRTNLLLAEQGAAEIDWNLDYESLTSN